MTNSDAGGVVAAEIIQAIAREYGWPGFSQGVITPIAMSPETMRQYVGMYLLTGSKVQLSIAVEDGQLMATQTGGAPFELVATGTDVLTPLVDAPPFRFERDSGGRVTTLVVGTVRLTRTP
jgi:hypothetical protein